ncbi:hypothetical protein FRC16_005812 [Serendipita sp. 398]|nr:hypothetical protein FRC16_005812 [Serendipita sp. 398]
MNSPTALTPEPMEADTSSLGFNSSFESSVMTQEQGSIPLSPSPLNVRANEGASSKTGTNLFNSPQDIPGESNTNITPIRPMPNQTPLKSTPLLTPPSSNERHPTMPLPSNRGGASSQTPLTERILATSALYSQAIQKQQQKVLSHIGQGHTQAAPITPAPLTDSRSQRPPHLTYHQLQQNRHKQQEQPCVTIRSNSVGDAEVANDNLNTQAPPPHTSFEAPHPFTVVELPNGAGSDDESKEQEVVKPIVPITAIPKPDPLENPLNTTNVYINGLPLRWTDDDLYRLTRGFGAVKSVKMFTRHLEDKPSAYGFVLFNCVEDAERFIVTLRQHTQFHPSFAKTGKVPGTTNSKHAIADPVIPLPRDEDFADIAITGLPLGVDKQTLRALFAPQVIKASKFFHTAGTPRRLVGFVRLETQQAAEDIVERLDGSNVLGWSEKLSVRILESANMRLGPTHPKSAYTTTPSQILGDLPTFAGAAAAPNSHAQMPSLGVYQHQNVHMNDVVRLVDSMKLGQAQPLAQVQDCLPAGPCGGAQPGTCPIQTPMTFPPFPGFNRISAPSMPLPQPNLSIRQSVGLGIGVPRLPIRSLEHGYGLLASQEPNTPQDVEPLHQTIFQSARDAPDQTLYSLQAAVIAQDLILGHEDPPFSHPRPTNETAAKTMPATTWGLPMRANTSSIENDPIQIPRFTLRNPMDSSTAYMVERGSYNVQNPGFLHQNAKVPGSGLSMASSNDPFATRIAQRTTKEAVPVLLPALTPSSPQGSSGSSSPITPAVGQLPEHPTATEVGMS